MYCYVQGIHLLLLAVALFPVVVPIVVVPGSLVGPLLLGPGGEHVPVDVLLHPLSRPSGEDLYVGAGDDPHHGGGAGAGADRADLCLLAAGGRGATSALEAESSIVGFAGFYSVCQRHVGGVGAAGSAGGATGQ